VQCPPTEDRPHFWRSLGVSEIAAHGGSWTPDIDFEGFANVSRVGILEDRLRALTDECAAVEEEISRNGGRVAGTPAERLEMRRVRKGEAETRMRVGVELWASFAGPTTRNHVDVHELATDLKKLVQAAAGEDYEDGPLVRHLAGSLRDREKSLTCE